MCILNSEGASYMQFVNIVPRSGAGGGRIGESAGEGVIALASSTPTPALQSMGACRAIALHVSILQGNSSELHFNV